jgi:hypothetical protein
MEDGYDFITDGFATGSQKEWRRTAKLKVPHNAVLLAIELDGTGLITPPTRIPRQ